LRKAGEFRISVETASFEAAPSSAGASPAEDSSSEKRHVEVAWTHRREAGATEKDRVECRLTSTYRATKSRVVDIILLSLFLRLLL
jgi:hypothetical protein